MNEGLHGILQVLTKFQSFVHMQCIFSEARVLAVGPKFVSLYVYAIAVRQNASCVSNV